MCNILDYGFMINGLYPLSRSCSGNTSDNIVFEMDAQMQASDVGLTVYACVGYTAPDGLGYEICSSPMLITGTGTQTIIISFNDVIANQGTGLYSVAGTRITTNPAAAPICFSNSPVHCDKLNVSATCPQVNCTFTMSQG